MHTQTIKVRQMLKTLNINSDIINHNIVIMIEWIMTMHEYRKHCMLIYVCCAVFIYACNVAV